MHNSVITLKVTKTENETKPKNLQIRTFTPKIKIIIIIKMVS